MQLFIEITRAARIIGKKHLHRLAHPYAAAHFAQGANNAALRPATMAKESPRCERDERVREREAKQQRRRRSGRARTCRLFDIKLKKHGMEYNNKKA